MRVFLALSLSMLLTLSSSVAQDLTALGGELTSSAPPAVALQLPAPNLNSAELTAAHFAGHADFHSSFEFRKIDNKQVLGPNFNHTSCGACHLNDGRGQIAFGTGRPGSSMLIRVSLPGKMKDGSPKPVPGVGTQLQDHTTSGKRRYAIRLRWRTVRKRYPDGTRYELRKPALRFSIPGPAPRRILSSLRMSPPIIGMGLLEAIPEPTLRSLADPLDTNNDGISGRVSELRDRVSGATTVGRFGFKAIHPTVREQTAAAFFGDMGVTSSLFGARAGTAPEISDELLKSVDFYQRAAGVTPARDQNNTEVIRGKALFFAANCSGCHTMTHQTGTSDIAILERQEIHPLTDLLLHDMGPGLADRRSEFSANGREWRTTPLWGLGLHRALSDHAPGYLHDGRARTIEEAILWHGGEAERSRNEFKKLSASDRQALLRFLESL